MDGFASIASPLTTLTQKSNKFEWLEACERSFQILKDRLIPLTTLTQKSKKFEWSEACDRSFQMLKDRLTSAHVLTLPEGTKGFFVYCDTSRVGLVFVIMQHGKVVVYASR